MSSIALFALAGLVLGIAHFAALRWTVDEYVRGSRGAIGWYAARVVAAAAVLFVGVRIGGPLVLASLAGFILARAIAVRSGRRERGAA